MSDPRDHSPSEPPIGGPQDARRFWERYRQADSGRGEYGTGRESGRGAPDPTATPGNGGSWSMPHPHSDHQCLEWCPICRTAEVLRAGASPELRDQLGSLQKDALVAVRAVLDSYLQRLEGQHSQARSRVEDIPIR